MKFFELKNDAYRKIIIVHQMRNETMNTTSDEDSWKIFRHDTEAGRLLSRLYGVPPSTIQVSYPKLQRRRTENCANDTTKVWKPSYCNHGTNRVEQEKNEKQRQVHKARALSLVVPKVGKGGCGVHDIHAFDTANAKIDMIPRRRSQHQCKEIIEDYTFVNKKFRPAHSRSFSSDDEKQRLTRMFVEKGGRCLPEDLTNPPAFNRVQLGDKEKRQGKQNETLFDQIYQEIVERREHQLAMEQLGAGGPTSESTAFEIKKRLELLMKIDQNRAIEISKIMTIS